MYLSAKRHLVVFITAFGSAGSSSTAGESLFISEYVEGTTSNRGLEIFNPHGVAVDLTANALSLRIYANGSAIPTTSIPLMGVIAAGGVFVIANTSAAFADAADQTSSSLSFTGDDTIELFAGGMTLDVFGQIGFDPGVEWGTPPNSTNDNTLRRRRFVCQGDATGNNSFGPQLDATTGEWDGVGLDAFEGLGVHESLCAPSCLADLDHSGNVNVSDLLAVIGAWGPCPNPAKCPADIAPVGGNDVVNVQDLLAVIGAWGACP